jgi:GNAT superfamily N-acetyltransferase
MDFTVRPVTSAQWPALEDLFGRSGASNGCWCMYWRIGPRYRDRPRADNKEDLRQLAASGRPPGLLAFDGDRAVGWCELAPRAELAWLARARYLGLVDDLPVWSVPCFYVRSSHRGLGVMDALIEAALPTAATAGAPALEAYPVDTTVPSHTGNLFPGIAAAFARHGFEVVARRKPDRPVMRKFLGDTQDRQYPDRDARPGRLGGVVLLRCQRGDELGPGVDVELAVDLAQVELDRLGRQEQVGRDVTV